MHIYCIMSRLNIGFAQVQIKFRTPNEKYAVPDTTLSVPSNVDSDGLNKLVKKLLLESSASEHNEVEKVQFDFILLDELVRGNLSDVLATREDVSFETVFEVLYIEKQRPPEPKKNVNHDDWVAGVSGKMNFFIQIHLFFFLNVKPHERLNLGVLLLVEPK